MGVPWKKMLEIGVGLAGVKLGEGQTIEIEKKEIELLKLMVKQQAITNALLTRLLDEKDPLKSKEIADYLEAMSMKSLDK